MAGEHDPHDTQAVCEWTLRLTVFPYKIFLQTTLHINMYTSISKPRSHGKTGKSVVTRHETHGHVVLSEVVVMLYIVCANGMPYVIGVDNWDIPKLEYRAVKYAR
jgi:hypothetical protein